MHSPDYFRLPPRRSILLWGLGAAFAAGAAAAADWTALNRVAQNSTDRQADAQRQIEALDDAAQEAYAEYRADLIELEGLRAYNRQLQALRDKQKAALGDLQDRIRQTGRLDRKIVPLMEQMLASLRAFVEADNPFLMAERQQRLTQLRAILDDPELSLAARYRSLYEAYQIELDYGHTMETYTDTLELDGRNLKVTVLRVGRIALFATTNDRENTYRWNPEAKNWEAIEDLSGPMQKAIRMAKKQVAPDLLVLPVGRPQNAPARPAQPEDAS